MHTHLGLIKLTGFGAAASLAQESPRTPKTLPAVCLIFGFCFPSEGQVSDCPRLLSWGPGENAGLSVRALIGKELLVTSPWPLGPVVAGARALGISHPLSLSLGLGSPSVGPGQDAWLLMRRASRSVSSPGQGRLFLQGSESSSVPGTSMVVHHRLTGGGVWGVHFISPAKSWAPSRLQHI